MLTVVCVLSVGPKRSYDRSHVERLRGMVAAHLDDAYEFVCLDDSPFPGWWAKISLFEPGRFKGRVLYLDLDVTVTGPLDDLAFYAARFVAIRDWERPGFNSSVMAWDAGAVDRLYHTFTPEVMDRLAGDQDWITEALPWKALPEYFPAALCRSYKRHIRPRLDHSLPPDCRVVCYHGRPKSWDLPLDHLGVGYG